ncbi:MAG: 16S rRNA (cytosine(967)-C(5))-methyltransferase RsmB [Candidatus Acidiferrales bacterium]
MPVSKARQIAFDILSRVESQDSYASDLLHAELAGKIKSEDAALATVLTMGVLRQKRLLDFLIDTYSRKRGGALDVEVAIALRMGIFQLRFLNRIPARAAVNESVELVKRARKRSATTFVNAILRRAADNSQISVATLVPGHLPQAEHLEILYSHPEWLIERWLKEFGEWRTIALLEENNRAPETAGAFLFPEERGAETKTLESEGIRISNGHWLRDAFRATGGNISSSGLFRKGRISVQDEASQIVPRLLNVEAGDSVLDLCAAPGGKTMTLARAAASGAFVVATDVYAHRLRAMRAQFERLKLKAIHVAGVDATVPLPFLKKFKRILVDAPCSGTGTLARNPEIRWRLAPADLAEFQKRQVAMLGSALAQLEDRGRLVFSTCSLEFEENERVVQLALGKVNGFRRVARPDLEAAIAPHLVAGASASSLVDATGVFRTFPPEQQTDGFFAVAIEKRP